MASSIISFRIDDGLREKVRSWSALEHRTISNFMEALLHRESELRDGEVVTLESLDVKLDRLLSLQSAQTKPAKVKEHRNERDREVLEQVLALAIPNSLSREVWKNWVIRLRKRNNKLDVVTAQAILTRWEKAEDNGYDLDELVELAIQRNYSDAVWDSQLERPKGGGGRSIADEQSRMFSECENSRSHAV